MPPKPPGDLCDRPLNVEVYRGAVVILGPGAVALAMTVDAAERSAELLAKAAQHARRGRPSK
jgi:hypothetical protein